MMQKNTKVVIRVKWSILFFYLEYGVLTNSCFVMVCYSREIRTPWQQHVSYHVLFTSFQ